MGSSWEHVASSTEAPFPQRKSVSESLLLSSVYLTVLSTGLPPTQGRKRKKMEQILPKTVKLPSPEKFPVW